MALVEVRDSGPGIAPAVARRLWSDPKRLERTSASGGLGLGLFICRSIVEQHGGSIEIESSPGEGTTVSVRLPLERQPATPAR